MDLIQTWFDDNYYCTLHFDTSLLDLDLASRSQVCKKAKTSLPIISQGFQPIYVEFCPLLRLNCVMNLILFLSYPLNIRGRDAYLYDFAKKKF